jgi:hypothetical protein
MCTKVHIGKHLSDNSPIQNGLEQEDALQYATISHVQENRMGLKLNETHQVLLMLMM